MNATLQFVPDIGAGWTCWASSPTRITGVPAMQQDGSFTLACTDSGGDTHTVTYFVRDGKPHMTGGAQRAVVQAIRCIRPLPRRRAGARVRPKGA